MANKGVPYQFWLRIDRERNEPYRRWSWDRVSEETAGHTDDGKAIPRSTIANWRTSSRRPILDLVYAVADALGIDRAEAAVLAGYPPEVLPDAVATSPRVASAIQELLDSSVSLETKAVILATMGRTDQFFASLRPVGDTPTQSSGDEGETGRLDQASDGQNVRIRKRAS